MRAEGFAALPQKRRIARHDEYIRMKGRALHCGEVCPRVVQPCASEGSAATEAEARRLSGPDADPSAP
jgi:hypothetical protein